jgi:hypothetical protein
MAMKTKSLFFVCLLSLSFASNAAAATRPRLFVLKEHTYDDRLYAIHKSTSVDYRSTISIQFAKSPAAVQAGIKTEVEIVRRSGGTFELPSRYLLQSSDSTVQEVRINLNKWAVEPGDQVHILIHHDLEFPYVFERYVSVTRHGWGGDLSFPILSVQRDGNHSGSLGAGVSYTLKYVQAERTLLNHLGLGLNLSFLDFDPEQKIEIGLGIAITFPDDLFQVGLGKNLTVKKDSGYYFLGINLPGIKEKLGL